MKNSIVGFIALLVVTTAVYGQDQAAPQTDVL